jgi:2-dehydro-3-deoxyphosphogluconate aldolase/(4S)-4-hydroxy-2-oxoglutarate aldolase
MRDNTIASILQHKVIAIARGISRNAAPLLAESLWAGGVALLEMTFDQSKPESDAETARTIADIREKFAGRLLVGAGTVLSIEQVRLAADAGAQYIISPNANESVIKTTRELGLVSIPGVLTPTECVQAHDWGADFCKLFPAGVLGASYVKAIAAPLKHLKFLAVGNINAKNAGEFIQAGALGLGVGGNLVSKAFLENGEAYKITASAREIIAAVQSAN